MIPNDPVMLLSYLNTKLRDQYSSLHALCIDLDLNEADLIQKLNFINYSYNEERNQFV